MADEKKEMAGEKPLSKKAIKKTVNDFTYEIGQMERITAINKVLKAFQMNPFDVLGLPTTATQEQIKKHYRKLSLQCHPDKVKEETRDKAQKAFTALAKARDEVTEEDKRPGVEAIVIAARQKVKTRLQQAAARVRRDKAKEKARKTAERKKNLLAGGEVEPDEEETAEQKEAAAAEKKEDVEQRPEFEGLVMKQIKEDIIDREWKARQMMKAAEAEAGKMAAEAKEDNDRREAVAKKKEDWENGRSTRIGGWRSFVKGKGKKGKKGKKRKGMAMPKKFEEDETHSYVRRPVKRPIM